MELPAPGFSLALSDKTEKKDMPFSRFSVFDLFMFIFMGGREGERPSIPRSLPSGLARARSAETQAPEPSPATSQDEHLHGAGPEAELGLEPRHCDAAPCSKVRS